MCLAEFLFHFFGIAGGGGQYMSICLIFIWMKLYVSFYFVRSRFIFYKNDLVSGVGSQLFPTVCAKKEKHEEWLRISYCSRVWVSLYGGMNLYVPYVILRLHLHQTTHSFECQWSWGFVFRFLPHCLGDFIEFTISVKIVFVIVVNMIVFKKNQK